MSARNPIAPNKGSAIRAEQSARVPREARRLSHNQTKLEIEL